MREQTRIWNPTFVTLFVISLIISMAQFMTMTLVPKLAESLGASSVVVGLATGIFAVTALAVRPAVGPATLTIRHHHLLGFTVVLIVVAMLTYAVTTNVTVLMVGRLIHGAAMGFLAPVTLAMASDALPRDRMSQGIGIFSLAQAVATALGPSAGLALLGWIGYRGTFLVSGGALVVALVLALKVDSPTPSRPRGQGFSWNQVVAKEAVVPAIVMFFLSGAFSTVNTFIVLYGESRDVAQIGLFFTAYAAFILLARPLAGRLADTRGPAVVIVPGMVIFGVAFVVISHAQTLTAFLVAGAIQAFGFGVCQPAIQAVCLTAVDDSRRGIASNTNFIGVDLGFLVMPVIAGRLVGLHLDAGASSAGAYAWMFRWMVLPVAIGLAIYLAHEVRTRSRASLT